MTPFGSTRDGQIVHALPLHAGDLSVTVLTLGAIVQSVKLAGLGYDLTVGSDRLSDYETTMPFNGALIAPVANRLARARAPIAGHIHQFEANQAGQHTLHSGRAGAQTKLWQVAEHGPDHATLSLTLPSGEGGFPGTRHLTARFRVTAPATVTLQLTGTTDAPTLMNIANHSYWNLDGSTNWAGHSLRIAADHYLPITEDTLPTGQIAPVTGTPFDLRSGRPLSAENPALDHNFCLSDGPMPLRDVLWLTGKSGVSMTLATTEPGVQIYDGRSPVRPGAAPYGALAIEAQGWPDAPNNPHFPSILCTPAAPYTQSTRWSFAKP